MERVDYDDSECFFDGVRDACGFVFWRYTQKQNRLNFRLDAC
jgi:hypothetical protein